MTIEVIVNNRIANYRSGDEIPVCGNSGNTIKFTFDDDWNGHDQKTARFIWGGKYHDVEFTGDTCEMPVVSNTSVVLVGVYAGEMREDGYMISTTLTSIPFLISTRCGNAIAQPASGANYTNEARGYAAAAKESEKAAAASAEEAKEAAEGAGGLTVVGSVSYSANVMDNDILLDSVRLPIIGELTETGVEGLDTFVRNEKVKFCKISLSTCMGVAETPLYSIGFSIVDTSNAIVGEPDIIAFSPYNMGDRSNVNLQLGTELYNNIRSDIEQELSWGEVTLTFTFYA